VNGGVFVTLFPAAAGLKRQSSNMGVTDLLVVVLMADAAQNAMASDYKSVPDGLVLVSTIVFWSYALDWLSFRFPRFGRFIHLPALELICNGRVNRINLRKELITIAKKCTWAPPLLARIDFARISLLTLKASFVFNASGSDESYCPSQP
jgi:hypothetical protein